MALGRGNNKSDSSESRRPWQHLDFLLFLIVFRLINSTGHTTSTFTTATQRRRTATVAEKGTFAPFSCYFNFLFTGVVPPQSSRTLRGGARPPASAARWGASFHTIAQLMC